MISLDDIIEEIENKKIKWLDIRENGISKYENINDIEIPLYSEITNFSDYASVAIIKSDANKITAILYESDNGYVLDLYDKEKLIGGTKPIKFCAKTFQLAKNAAEEMIKEAAGAELIYMRNVLNRYF